MMVAATELQKAVQGGELRLPNPSPHSDPGAVPDPVSLGLHLAMRGWIRLHGIVSLEIAGQLDSFVADTDALFAEEMHALLAEYGL